MPREPRLRDCLTRDEVTTLLRAAEKGPHHGARNHAMMLLAYRHGLRASEVVNLSTCWKRCWTTAGCRRPHTYFNVSVPKR